MYWVRLKLKASTSLVTQSQSQTQCDCFPLTTYSLQLCNGHEVNVWVNDLESHMCHLINRGKGPQSWRLFCCVTGYSLLY